MRMPVRTLAWLAVLSLPAAAQPAVRVTVFHEPGFPTLDAPALAPSDLPAGGAGLQVRLAGLDALGPALRDGTDVLLLPCGSAFPEDAWPAIEAFLDAGGCWVNLGGVPLSRPMTRAGGGWRVGPPTAAYHRALGLVHALPVEDPGPRCVSVHADAPLPEDLLAQLRPARAWSFDVRLTTAKTVPAEEGSDGEREARLRPLVHGLRADGWPASAPLVELDRLAGRWAGGRWVLAACDARLPPALVEALLRRAAQGASELELRPALATYAPGESPAVALRLLLPGARAAAGAECELRWVPRDPPGAEAGAGQCTRRAADGVAEALLPVGPPGGAGPGRGLWTVEVAAITRLASGARLSHAADTGFVVREPSDLAGGPAWGTSRDWFTRDGAPLPVLGMSWMAPDVQRRFLEEPDPLAWERDFRDLERAGVNLVRTGIWTGWARLADADGRPHEATLRSLEALLLVARRHGIGLCFTAFAFTPPAFGGVDPWFDPRSLEGQRRFLAALGQRFAGAGDLTWDLVNEPSFAPADRAWSTRPHGDAFEQQAWRIWLERRHDTARDGGAALRARWRLRLGEEPSLPQEADFADRHLPGTASPSRALDYRLFAQHAFRGWAQDMVAALRAAGAGQPVTVGQDEGGLLDRPSPQFFGDVVDSTSVHTWWFNGDLGWSGLLTRLPDRPALVQETGLMAYERQDGTLLRDARAAAALFDRKLAYALAQGGAGFVPWAWSTNPYMPSDNEAGIGLLRADGSARPEQAVFLRHARAWREAFAGGCAPRDREPAPAVLVVPHSRQLSTRDLSSDAVRRTVRLYDRALRVDLRATSEYALARDLGTPRLLVLPAPGCLDEDAWRRLEEAVAAGATLVASGPLDEDPYGLPTGRMERLGLPAGRRPVGLEHRLDVDGAAQRVTFAGGLLDRLEAAAGPGGAPGDVRVVPLGEGRVVYCPLPVELAEDDAAARALHGLACRLAGVQPAVRVEPDDPAVLVRALDLAACTAVIAISEGDRDLRLAITLPGPAERMLELDLPAGGSALRVAPAPQASLPPSPSSSVQPSTRRVK